MGVWCTDLCQLKECSNSEIAKEDNDECLSDYKADNEDDWFFIIFCVIPYFVILAADCFMLLSWWKD